MNEWMFFLWRIDSFGHLARIFVLVDNKSYKRYQLETTYTDRTYYGEVQCTRTITLLLLFFELSPLVNFHFEFLSGSLLPNYKSYQLDTSQTDRTHFGEMQCTRTVTLLLIFLIIALC